MRLELPLLVSFAYVLILETCDGAMQQRCFSPKKPGNKSCGKGKKYYFYDHNKGRCSSFTYYGCSGNENRFRKRKECQLACACSADLQYGKACKNITKPKVRYYWEAESRMCRKFWYVGCSGNHNRFESKSRCKKVCGGYA